MYVSPDLASLLFLLSCILFLPYLECAAVNPAQDVVTACRMSEWQKLWEKDSCHLGTWCAYFFQVISLVQILNMQFLLHKAFWYFQKQNYGGNCFFVFLFLFLLSLFHVSFHSFFSIISGPLFLYVTLSALLGPTLENEWEFCHIQSAVHLTLGVLLNSSHCFPMNTRIRVKPFHFVWVAWGTFESSVLRLMTWSSAFVHTIEIHACH